MSGPMLICASKHEKVLICRGKRVTYDKIDSQDLSVTNFCVCGALHGCEAQQQKVLPMKKLTQRVVLRADKKDVKMGEHI